MIKNLSVEAIRFLPFGAANLAATLLACEVVRYLRRAEAVRSLTRGNFEALIASRNALRVQLMTSSSRPVVKTRVASHLALEALQEFTRVADEFGLDAFLFFGTLLGAVREQRLIPGDTDVDLGVLDSVRLREFSRFAGDRGFKAGRIREEENRPSKLVLWHANGATIDLKGCDVEEDGSTVWFTHSGRLVLKRRFPRQVRLTPMMFAEIPVMIPDCAAEFLEWQYGSGWRTPDASYHMLTSGPLQGNHHRRFVSQVGPLAILRVLLEGRVPKACAMVSSMARLFPEDDLWPRFSEALSDAHAEAVVVPQSRA